VANESIVKLKSSESNYSLLDKHLLSFGTVLVPEMCVHTIDPSIEGPASSFADEYADQLSREFQQTPDRISDGIPQFDVLILGLDPEGRAAGLVAPPTLSVPPPHRHSVVSCVKLLYHKSSFPSVSLRFRLFVLLSLPGRDDECSDTLVLAIPPPLLPPATPDPASLLKLQVRRCLKRQLLFCPASHAVVTESKSRHDRGSTPLLRWQKATQIRLMKRTTRC
jgi:hypothetical protein